MAILYFARPVVREVVILESRSGPALSERREPRACPWASSGRQASRRVRWPRGWRRRFA